MEMSSVLVIAVLALAYVFYQRQERLRAAVRRYASALAGRGIDLEYREDDPTAGLRLQRIAAALRRAEFMKRKDWRGQAELMQETVSSVSEAGRDDVLASVDLQPGRPGYDESSEAARAMSARLERMRAMQAIAFG